MGPENNGWVRCHAVWASEQWHSNQTQVQQWVGVRCGVLLARAKLKVKYIQLRSAHTWNCSRPVARKL